MIEDLRISISNHYYVQYIVSFTSLYQTSSRNSLLLRMLLLLRRWIANPVRLLLNRGHVAGNSQCGSIVRRMQRRSVVQA